MGGPLRRLQLLLAERQHRLHPSTDSRLDVQRLVFRRQICAVPDLSVSASTPLVGSGRPRFAGCQRFQLGTLASLTSVRIPVPWRLIVATWPA
jgi:hypothetical protein